MILHLLLAWPLTACAGCAGWAVYRRDRVITAAEDDAQSSAWSVGR